MASTEGNRHEKRSSAAPPEIPDKLYFRIGEVAKLLDLPAYVLRFWETEFPQLKPGKGGTGQRLYRRREVELVLRIRSLLYDEGYTIPGARQLLKAETRPGPKPQAKLQPVSVQPPVAPEPETADPEIDAISAAIRLSRMRAELREIALLLAEPTARSAPQIAPAPRANPAHRGLHVATPRRRPTLVKSASLFPDGDSDTGNQTEK